MSQLQTNLLLKPSARVLSMIGEKYGRLLVIGVASFTPNIKARLNCVCECGTPKNLCSGEIRRGNVHSCGCLRRELSSKRLKGKKYRMSHGHRGRITPPSPTYESWRGMRERCDNPKAMSHPNYGGRGIAYDASWNKFASFLSDMGERPEGTSLDRVDSNGNYEKSNCRWASKATQSNNRRNTHLITFAGITHSMTEWAQLLGMPPKLLSERLRRGDTFERAMRGYSLALPCDERPLRVGEEGEGV